MKNIAFLLLLFFAVVQVAPAIKAIMSATTSMFIAEEEKSEEKGSCHDKKENKDYVVFSSQSSTLTGQLNTAFLVAEKIHPSPCTENLTPPPNFC